MDERSDEMVDKARDVELENQVSDICRAMSLMSETERLAVLEKVREIAARY